MRSSLSLSLSLSLSFLFHPLFISHFLSCFLSFPEWAVYMVVHVQAVCILTQFIHFPHDQLCYQTWSKGIIFNVDGQTYKDCLSYIGRQCEKSSTKRTCSFGLSPDFFKDQSFSYRRFFASRDASWALWTILCIKFWCQSFIKKLGFRLP